MSSYLSERIAVVGTIDPQEYGSSTEKFTDVIDTAEFQQFMFVFMLGNMVSASITCRVVNCDSSGDNASALKTATVLAASASGNDNDQIVIAVSADELASKTNKYLKGGIVSASSASVVFGAVVLAGDARYGPASNDDLATVVEIETDLD
jgi:hypothetical protein